jgi:uncharacterized FlgJ-related protein
MKKYNFFNLLFLFLLISPNCFSQNNYFKDYKKLGDSLSLIYKIPSCVILSVAYIESGGGTSTNARKLNNHFGIVGNCQYQITKHKSKYRYFPSIKSSYIGFCELVKSKSFYSSMINNTDEALWLKKIAATGYAADANKWSNTVYNIIKSKCK